MSLAYLILESPNFSSYSIQIFDWFQGLLSRFKNF